MQIKTHDRSHLVELRDGSAWRIWPGDIPKTLQWLPTTEIDVTDIDDEICSHAPYHNDSSHKRFQALYAYLEYRSLLHS